MAVKIDNKFPLPPAKRRAKFIIDKYPFSDMKVGDSFYIPAADSSDDTVYKIRKTLIASGAYFNKANNTKWKFATRKIGSGIRIWGTK